MKNTVKNIISAKGNTKLTMLTAYDALFASLADEAGADIILVGDSLGNTVLGYKSTVPVTMEDMLHHSAAVVRGVEKAFVVADIPFAIAHKKFDVLLDASARLVQEAGVDAVKIEGGKKMAKKISKLSEAGIAVMAHIGLEPQQVMKLGGYRKFGKTDEEKQTMLDDAKALEEAGAFSLVMEMTDPDLAAEITREISIPTIGIGSGPSCDGQVLVCADVLGFTQNPPKFVRKYADLRSQTLEAYAQFIGDVKLSNFPPSK